MDIYQAIWDADMKGNGLQPIMANGQGDKTQGYVVVNTDNCGSKHHILQEVHIPDQKRKSYQLVEKLFDNYTLNQWRMEKNTPDELQEVEEFLKMAIGSLPLQLAKKFIEEKLNYVFSGEEWYSYLYTLWFNQFDWETSQDLSGFEHVFVGEQKGKKLVGHHFWYKYWLEDNLHDQIEMNCALQDENQHVTPYVVTLGYHLRAYDEKKRRSIRIGKKRCAFFVGLSGEGLLALGTVRALSVGTVPDEFVLNNVRYKLELYRSPDGKSIRTFYPIPLIENTGSI
jgi:poly(U)-specific endoribonuclease